MDEDKRIRLSEVVKKARGKRTQRQFAKYLGVSFAAVRSWEEQESYPGLPNLEKIAASSGMSTDDLLAYLKGEITYGEASPKAKTAEDLLPFVDNLPASERKKLIRLLIEKDY
ncbi:MAG: helix-turn-helix domain-containing protein [Chroococcidiopsis sp.]